MGPQEIRLLYVTNNPVAFLGFKTADSSNKKMDILYQYNKL